VSEHKCNQDGGTCGLGGYCENCQIPEEDKVLTYEDILRIAQGDVYDCIGSFHLRKFSRAIEKEVITKTQRCKYPLCQSEEEQDRLAKEIKEELFTGPSEKDRIDAERYRWAKENLIEWNPPGYNGWDKGRFDMLWESEERNIDVVIDAEIAKEKK
jgi:hypothetical protein